MLLSLRLQNIALFDSQELAFHRGFTVITGETGSGKSILLASLDALLGGGQSSTISGLPGSQDKLFLIEGIFSINSTVKNWLLKNQIDIDDTEILVSREWRLKDDRLKSKCRINGIYINRSQILQLRPLLIEFTSQGYSYRFNSLSHQIECLDRFGLSLLNSSIDSVKESWIAWSNAEAKLYKIKHEINDIIFKSQELKETLEELENLYLEDPNEAELLQNEIDRLANVVTLQEGFNKLLSRLKEGSEDLPGTLDQIGDSVYELKSMMKIDSSLIEKYNNVSDIYDFLKEFINSLDQYISFLESDPQRLDEIQLRLQLLKKIQRRHGLNLSELINKRNELRESFSNVNLDDQLLEAENNELKAKEIRDKHNQKLTILRKQVALKFETRLMEILASLGLSNIRFKIEITSSEPSQNGVDTVRFFFSANPGQPMLPIEKIASGGEMSRFVLAFKTMLSSIDGSRTFIFDEIDSGVSGRVSRSIASLLKEISIKTQVFCVTHQPLVAALADNHISISKSVVKGQTSAKIKYLTDFSDRQKELAELAGGDLAEAKVYAASLLEQHAA